MIGLNPLKVKVLITVDEVIFHAPTDSSADPRTLLNNIIVAERRFIKPMLCDTVYDALVEAKNKVVDAGNLVALQADLNAGRASDREIIPLVVGDIVNSDTYLSTVQQTLWQTHLHKIVAECVWLAALPVNRARFTAGGVIKNHPENVTGDRESVTVDLPDLKHLLDKGLNERIGPLMEDMHKYLCKTAYPGYKRDCGCDTHGNNYNKATGVLFGLYDEDDHDNRRSRRW